MAPTQVGKLKKLKKSLEIFLQVPSVGVGAQVGLSACQSALQVSDTSLHMVARPTRKVQEIEVCEFPEARYLEEVWNGVESLRYMQSWHMLLQLSCFQHLHYLPLHYIVLTQAFVIQSIWALFLSLR